MSNDYSYLIGWLTKGKCEIAIIDIMVLAIEIVLLTGLILLITYVYSKLKGKHK